MGLQTVQSDHESALAALAWLVDAGVDTLVDDAPRVWAVAPVEAVVSAAISAAPAVRTAPMPVARAPSSERVAAATQAALSADSLPALKAALGEWLGQPLLFADGSPDGGVLVLGDMPSPDDVAAGQVFAGAAGRLLDRMLAAIGRSRADTYLTTLLPLPRHSDEDLAVLLPFARRHIALARPRAVLALGGAAAGGLLGVTSGIARLRGQWTPLELGDFSVPVLASFTPAYLLTHPAHKALAWADLQRFRDALA